MYLFSMRFINSQLLMVAIHKSAKCMLVVKKKKEGGVKKKKRKKGLKDKEKKG